MKVLISSYSKMAFLLFLFCCCLAGTPGLSVAQYDKELAQAAEAYSNNNFESSINLYEQILANGWESFEVYYNLGNAYYKTDQIAEAILNYERAALIDPTDEDLLHNLNMARSRTVDKISMIAVPQFVSGYKAFVNGVSADTWGIISLISFFGILGLIIFFLSASQRWIKQTILGFILLFFLTSTISFLFGWQQKNWRNSNKEAIIFQASINIQSTPDQNGKELFVLHEGTKVQIVERFKDWVRIRIGDGKTGWVEQQAIAEI